MNELHAKFAVALVALGFFFTYALPAMKEMKHNHDFVIQQVGSPYATPSPAQPKAENGTVNDGQR
jgi:hypothetical protein